MQVGSKFTTGFGNTTFVRSLKGMGVCMAVAGCSAGQLEMVMALKVRIFMRARWPQAAAACTAVVLAVAALWMSDELRHPFRDTDA